MKENQLINYQNKITTKTIESEKLQLSFLDSGDIFSIKDEHIFINQLQANYLDGMVMNIYLRQYKDGVIVNAYPLLGQASTSEFSYSNNSLKYTGSVLDASYKVLVSLSGQSIFYNVEVDALFEYDLIFVQDVAISAGVMNNEAYCSQYIDIKAIEQSNGYTLAFRQNQATYKGNAYLELGTLNSEIVSYATDGFDFYGLTYKETNEIKGLTTLKQTDRIYQYEFSMGVLQTKILKGYTNTTFYMHYQQNHKSAIESLDYFSNIQNDLEILTADNEFEISPYSPFKYSYLSGNEVNSEAVLSVYNNTRHLEFVGDTLLSFFANENKHVVLKAKEEICERAHGHILLACLDNQTYVDKLSATNYIYGVFPSQVICGNTNLNKMNSNMRNGLNVQKLSGQRIWIKRNDQYCLLGMPSYFEMDLNAVKWVYLLDDDKIEVDVSISHSQNVLQVSINSQKTQDFIISNHMVVGAQENENAFDLSISDTMCIVKPANNTFLASKYQNIDFTIKFNQAVEFEMDKMVDKSQGLLCASVHASSVSYVISGNVDGDSESIANFLNVDEESVNYRAFIKNTLKGFELSHNTNDVSKMNDLVYWYTHNMMIHYQSPHGLEQYGGAAWGSRDVCQGPFEYYLATQNFDVVKTILLEIFAHQFIEDGSWPQWFMFDRYLDIFADESHGDIIVWPLYALAQYLERTSDFSILSEQVSYISKETRTLTSKDTLKNHLLKEIQYIKNHYLEGTHLSSYGDGDWDDTLQPANPLLRKTMVSGWTTTLTYDAFIKLANALQFFDQELAEDLLQQANAIKSDYLKYVVKDGVVAGFLHFENDKVNYLIHPSDKTTGLNYRLLPMTRSIIGEMFTKEMALSHKEIINKNLYHPDGVRLMNTTCTYQGGVNTYFMRAETAANFGREIGLQYVHAHIRYVEAMAKLGDANETWSGLMKINPIQINETVKNACVRQANAYFSSSDGQFANRYEAMANFEKLRTGDVNVKGGWRIYSSGPGIFLNQLISNVLGIRVSKDNLILDPIIPSELDDLKLTFAVDNTPVTITYKFDSANPRVEIDGYVYTNRLENAYRKGAFEIPKQNIQDNANIIVFI